MADRDEMGQLEFAWSQFGCGDRTQTGVLHRLRPDVAGVQLIDRPVVIAFLVVRQRSNQGDVVHLRGDVVPAFRNPDSAHGCFNRLSRSAGFCARFGIECLELTRGTAHE